MNSETGYLMGEALLKIERYSSIRLTLDKSNGYCFIGPGRVRRVIVIGAVVFIVHSLPFVLHAALSNGCGLRTIFQNFYIV
jgi:hypothetical protein